MILAAVLAGKQVFGGTNVENANFTLTKHAEEVAILAALLAGGLSAKKAVDVLYVTGGPPCGSCRQFLLEFGRPDTVVLIDHLAKSSIRKGRLATMATDSIEAWRLSDLLPVPFTGRDVPLGDAS